MMNQIPRLLLSLLLCLSVVWPLCAQNEEQIVWDRPISLPMPLTEYFAGAFSGQLLLGGGCSPTDSIGNRRVFLYTGQEWQEIGRLPHELTASLCVSSAAGVLVVGGRDDRGSLQAFYRLSVVTGALHIDTLPALPLPLERAVGGVVNNILIVGGGESNGLINNSMWSISLTSPKAWRTLSPLPTPLVGVPTAVQNSGTDDLFYCFTDSVYAYSLRQDRWLQAEPSYSLFSGGKSLCGSAAFPVGTHHIALGGSGDRLLTYHTVTRQWSALSLYPYPSSPYNVAVTWGGTRAVIGHRVYPFVFKHSTSFGWLNYTVLILYLLAMVGIGFYFNRKPKTADSFFKGSGKIPWWAAGISIFATTLSAITFMAIPAKTYVSNWLYFPMSFAILLLAPVIIKWYLPFFRGMNLTSAYEYLERRFNLSARLLSSLFFIVFMVTRIAIVLYLPAVAMSTVTGISIFTCIALMAAVTALYATLGGVEAVVWSDVVQGFILVGGAIISLIYIVVSAGGLTQTIEIAHQGHKLEVLDFAFNLTQPTFWVIFFGAGLANSFITYSSDQTIIQRYLTTSDTKKAARSIWLNGLISLPVLVLFYFIGTGLYAYYASHPQVLPVMMQNAEGIFPYFIVNELPAGVAGILIAAIFAATMSTLSSNMNSASTAITCDFVKKIYPRISDRGEVISAQISGLLVCALGTLLAVLLSTLNIKSFFDEFNTFIGLLTGGLGGLFAIGIFLPRVRGRAALVGLVGSLCLLLWMRLYSPLNFMLYGLIGIVSCMSIAYVMSFILREKRRDLTGLCWKYRLPRSEK